MAGSQRRLRERRSLWGLIGSAQAFGCFLQDQLLDGSVLLSPESKALLYTAQKTSRGELIEMTLGWHIGDLQGVRYFFKEGGGGGFHSEMRIYPAQQFASVLMVNSTEFSSKTALNQLDSAFLQA
jgi:D-alanyl-D-alanine carboxypeptidase